MANLGLRPKNHSNSGFSFVEITFTLVILSVGMLALATLNQRLTQQLVRTGQLNHLDIYKRNVNAVILDSSSWKNTVRENSTGGMYSGGRMDCILNSTPCTTTGASGGPPISGQPFALLDAANSILIDATATDSGFTLDGTLCKGFVSLTAGTSGISPADNPCVFRYKLTWSARCLPADTCINPQILVTADLILGSGSDKAPVMNPGRFAVKAYRASLP